MSFNTYHNIYCISDKGHLLWQIGPRPKADESVYTMISFLEDKARPTIYYLLCHNDSMI